MNEVERYRLQKALQREQDAMAMAAMTAYSPENTLRLSPEEVAAAHADNRLTDEERKAANLAAAREVVDTASPDDLASAIDPVNWINDAAESDFGRAALDYNDPKSLVNFAGFAPVGQAGRWIEAATSGDIGRTAEETRRAGGEYIPYSDLLSALGINPALYDEPSVLEHAKEGRVWDAIATGLAGAMDLAGVGLGVAYQGNPNWKGTSVQPKVDASGNPITPAKEIDRSGGMTPYLQGEVSGGIPGEIPSYARGGKKPSFYEQVERFQELGKKEYPLLAAEDNEYLDLRSLISGRATDVREFLARKPQNVPLNEWLAQGRARAQRFREAGIDPAGFAEIEKQREAENIRTALLDPQTGNVYFMPDKPHTNHAIIAHSHGLSIYNDNLVGGFLDENGRFIMRDEAPVPSSEDARSNAGGGGDYYREGDLDHVIKGDYERLADAGGMPKEFNLVEVREKPWGWGAKTWPPGPPTPVKTHPDTSSGRIWDAIAGRYRDEGYDSAHGWPLNTGEGRENLSGNQFALTSNEIARKREAAALQAMREENARNMVSGQGELFASQQPLPANRERINFSDMSDAEIMRRSTELLRQNRPDYNPKGFAEFGVERRPRTRDTRGTGLSTIVRGGPFRSGPDANVSAIAAEMERLTNAIRGQSQELRPDIEVNDNIPGIGHNQGPPEDILAMKRAQLAAKGTGSVREILKKTKEGGSTVNLNTYTRPNEGYAVGIRPNTDPRTTVLDKKLTGADLRDFVKKNTAALAGEERHLGTWTDPATGKTYVDVVQRFPQTDTPIPEDYRKPIKTGEKTGQIAIYDLGRKEQVDVGNWRDFINSDEFWNRLMEMEQRGSDYLKQFPNEEWWDIHGSRFEDVYGPDLLPDVAGNIAATAPGDAPRANLQKASEYMRRKIKGEPAIQPDWRVGDTGGEPAFRNVGTMIGMEESRANNLEKVRGGLLDQLQADKVREEAAALMGDPSAVVLDRWHARMAEKPSAGVFTNMEEGVVKGEGYSQLKEVFVRAAEAQGRDPRDFSADVWTGIRDYVQKNDELYGAPYKGAAIAGESKSYADHFVDLINEKAAKLNIPVEELERRLKNGDANLLSFVLAAPVGFAILKDMGLGGEEGDQPPGGA